MVIIMELYLARFKRMEKAKEETNGFQKKETYSSQFFLKLTAKYQ